MTPRRQMLIAVLAGVGLTILFFVLVLGPKLREIGEARERVEAARQETQRLQNELRRLEEVRRNAPRTTARLATVTEYLPSSSDLPGFIRLVQDAATRAGVDLRSIGPGAPAALEDSQGIQTIAVSISARGAFRAVEDLLARLENLERVVEVTSLSLAPATDELTGGVVLDSTIQLVMYVVQSDARITGVGSGQATIERPTASPSPTGEAS